MQGTPEDIKAVSELKTALLNFTEWVKKSDFYRKRVKVEDLLQMLGVVVAVKGDTKPPDKSEKALEALAELKTSCEPLFFSIMLSIMEYETMLSIMEYETNALLEELSKDKPTPADKPAEKKEKGKEDSWI